MVWRQAGFFSEPPHERNSRFALASRLPRLRPCSPEIRKKSRLFCRLAIGKRESRDKVRQSREEPGRETTERATQATPLGQNSLFNFQCFFNLFISSLYILDFIILLSIDNGVLETSKRRAVFYIILSQIFIVKCFTKSLLIRISKKDLDIKKSTPNLEVCPESLGAIYRTWRIGLFVDMTFLVRKMS